VKSGSGSLSYFAPERMEGTGHKPPADVWAIGIIAYYLLVG